MRRPDGTESVTVTVRLMGGLGNQLFQYAFGRRMALANRAELILDGSGYQDVRKSDARLGIRDLGLQHFSIQGRIVTEPTARWTSPSSMLPERPWVKRKALKWSRLLARAIEARLPQGLQRLVSEDESRWYTFDHTIYQRGIAASVVFEGYWQTEKYFADIEPLIRQDLTVVEPLEGENARMAARIQDCESVAIHVRHGDNASGVETGMGVLPQAFYVRAIECLRQKVQTPRFFVFSDDMEWARSNLQLGGESTFVSQNDDTHNYEDLRLMAMCKHHIVANSTFSWWGAWLGRHEGQVVLAPRRYWLNVDRPNPELYPADWQLL